MRTVVENNVTGEKKIFENQPPMPAVTAGLSMDEIVKAANAIANAPAGEVEERLKKALGSKPKKAAKKATEPTPTPEPKAAAENQEDRWRYYYVAAVLRSHTAGAYDFRGQGLEDLLDVLAGIPCVQFMSYPDWKAARGYGQEKNPV